jgi:hypothetical protein
MPSQGTLRHLICNPVSPSRIGCLSASDWLLPQSWRHSQLCDVDTDIEREQSPEAVLAWNGDGYIWGGRDCSICQVDAPSKLFPQDFQC